MEKISIQKLAKFSYEDVVANKTKYLVKFDDGVEKPLHASHILLSWPYWAIHRHYTQVKIPSELCYDYHREINDDSHKELISLAIKHTRDYPEIDKYDVWAIAYRYIYNKAFNLAVAELPQYANTIDFDDIEQLLEDPEIKKSLSKVTDSVESIDVAHNTIRKVISTKKYPYNGISVTTNNKSVPMNQSLQMALRGRTTEVNSVIFDRAIKSGFGTGFTSIADFVKECTSATKSFVYNDGYIAFSEYFSRKMQLLTSAITTLFKGDCGSMEYLDIHLADNKAGRVLFDRCIGSYHLNSKKKWELIEKDSTHLIGQKIKLRTSLGCNHLTKQGICEKCYGDLAYNIPDIDSPGHVSCITVTERASQSILSVKHLDFIIFLFRVVLNQQQAKIFEVIPKEPNRVHVKAKADVQFARLRVLREELPNFTRLSYTNNLKLLEIGEISSITKYWVDYLSPDGECVVSDEFEGVISGVPASLTVEFFRFLRRNPDFIIDDTNERFIEFKLEGFNKTQDGKPRNVALFEYQQRHESMPVYVTNLENILRSSKSNSRYNMITDYDGSTAEGCAEAMLAVHMYLERKLPGTPITHIATILASLRRQSESNPALVGGFGNSQARFDKHTTLMEERSLGPYLVYQEQNDIYYRPRTFVTPYRHNSLLDNAVYIPKN